MRSSPLRTRCDLQRTRRRMLSTGGREEGSHAQQPAAHPLRPATHTQNDTEHRREERRMPCHSFCIQHIRMDVFIRLLTPLIVGGPPSSIQDIYSVA